MDAEYDAAAAVAGSTMYWDYGKGGYGLLAADGSERTALTDALVRPYPERVAGDPVAYAFDEATRTFTLTYRPDRDVAAPTEIAVPARVYPGGFVVDCGGCAADSGAAGVTLRTPPPGDPATVTIRPR